MTRSTVNQSLNSLKRFKSRKKLNSLKPALGQSSCLFSLVLILQRKQHQSFKARLYFQQQRHSLDQMIGLKTNLDQKSHRNLFIQQQNQEQRSDLSRLITRRINLNQSSSLDDYTRRQMNPYQMPRLFRLILHHFQFNL